MVHTEQITTFKYTGVQDGSAGYYPGIPEAAINAPKWATINNIDGGDFEVMLRKDTLNRFEIFCNYRSDFHWTRDMFIISRFGNIDITNIIEDKRKRQWRLEGTFISGDDGQSGTLPPSGSAGVFTVYARSEYGSTSINIPQVEGMSPLIFGREGIIKEVVTLPGNQTRTDQVYFDGNNFNLISGDIFGDGELITVLYKSL